MCFFICRFFFQNFRFGNFLFLIPHSFCCYFFKIISINRWMWYFFFFCCIIIIDYVFPYGITFCPLIKKENSATKKPTPDPTHYY